MMLSAVLSTPENSRLRRHTCQKLMKFSDYIGIEVDLGPYQGSYGRRSVKARDLPTDEQIEEWYSDLKSLLF